MNRTLSILLALKEYPMVISERIFQIMEEKHISQTALSERTGISQRTISDWKRKKTNPTLEKVIPLCRALGISPTYLLTGEEDPAAYVIRPAGTQSGLQEDEQLVVDYYNGLSEVKKKRLVAYMKGLSRRK